MSFGTSIGIQAGSVVTGVLLARVLGVEGRGELAAVVLWPSIFAAVVALGMTEALTYHVSRASAPLTSFVGAAVAITLAQAVILVAGAALALPFIFAGYDDEALRAAYIFLLHIPLWLLGVYLMSVLNGLQRFGAFQTLRFLPIAVNVVGLVAVALIHELTVTTAMLVYLTADVVTLASAAALVGAASRPVFRFERAAAASLLRYGVRSHLGGVAVLLTEQLGQLVVSIFLGPVKLGLYVIAVTLSAVTQLVGTSVFMVALPSVARVDDPVERTAAVRRFFVITLLVTTAVTVPMIVAAPALIRLFFGADFEAAGDIARVVLVAAAIFSANRTLSAVMRALNRPLAAGVAELGVLLATVAALAVLLPALGLLGAALSGVVAAAIGTVLLGNRASRALGTPARFLVFPARERVPHTATATPSRQAPED